MAEILPIGVARAEAARRLLAGEAIAIPTETVYGLAADATNGEAVARIFEIKGRPRFNPLIAHVASLDMAERIAIVDPLSRKLAEAFWPGPLTIVLPLRKEAGIHPLVTTGLETIALRMPVGFASDLIAEIGRPLAAPSANSSGRISGTTAEAVERDLGSRIGLIVDGGPTPIGLESSIVKVQGASLRLLRPGGAPAEAIETAAGVRLERGSEGNGGEKIEAPGMLLSHYAPKAAVRLDAEHVRPGETLLAFGPKRIKGMEKASACLNLSPSGDLREAAANLFTYMDRLDASGAAVMAVEPIPRSGLGEAINDRLKRAAAPRDTPSRDMPPSRS